MIVTNHGYEFSVKVYRDNRLAVPEEFKVNDKAKATIYELQFGAIPALSSTGIANPCIIREDILMTLTEYLSKTENPALALETFLRSKKPTYFVIQPGLIICTATLEINKATNSVSKFELRLFLPYEIVHYNNRVSLACKYYSTETGHFTLGVTREAYAILYRAILQRVTQLLPNRRSFISKRL